MTQTEISAIDPDWSREAHGLFEWNPPRQLLSSIRRFHIFNRSIWKKIPLLGWVLDKCHVLKHRFWTIVSGADIPLNCQIEGGLLMPHPSGVVIHPSAKIGVNCLLMSQVVIGVLESGEAPKIGGHVDIGSGAKILGPVTIGDHVKIGANAVVLIDVPSGSTVVGVPAKIV